MKKFTKLFLSCAIVSAVAAASATMAMAADLDATYSIGGAGSEALNGTYTTSSNDVTLKGITPDADTQVTFLVYQAGTDETVISADNVIGIDQFSSGTDRTVQPTNNGLKSGSVTAPDEGQNKYIVKVGYYENGTFKTSTAFFLTGEAAATILLGDVNADTRINLSDATAIVNHAMEVEGKELTGDALIAANVNDDTRINLSDATCIVNYAMETETGYGHVGEYK